MMLSSACRMKFPMITTAKRSVVTWRRFTAADEIERACTAA
eukprot:CAMPEP_0119420158 /NCGR_PEP_ID=MMETSP1335-20130426/22818_1 /TAXON_ID=259385 /ORGANISM="Chrysoculter rhomboideus, Strain RCC1486" /LENGTH=40 /DNA_ID= /DNA_START= /DNA_END= /DNA_ORIENTATION=